MLAPRDSAFEDYVSCVLQFDLATIDIVAPATVAPIHALDVIEDLNAIQRITERASLAPFVLDRRVRAFAAATGMPIIPFATLPSEPTLAAVHRLNTKQGFREIASTLSLPIAEGGYATTIDELVRNVAHFLRHYPAAIIKPNRSSNGCGNAVVWGDAAAPIEQQIRTAISRHPAQTSGWVFEEYLPFESLPSIEMQVHEHSVEEFYTCDQRSVNNSWTGMVTPANPGPMRETLVKAAAKVGDWLRAQGYRGFFDIDCGVVGDQYVATEANVRRTGGTYLEELARRLCWRDKERATSLHWRADARVGTTRMDLAGAVRAINQAGLNDSAVPVHAILTANTVHIDGKWRYLLVGSDAATVAEAEQILLRILELPECCTRHCTRVEAISTAGGS
jgi:hypothetical protein